MNKVELFIGEKGKFFTTLDLDSNFDIALQYSIADVKDITKRNSAFSKTIVLPGTKNNNYALGNLFDVKSDFSIFNPNKKTPAKLLINSQVVIDGFLQLRNIVKETETNHEGNEIRYEVVIYDNTIDLMTELGEKTLSDLDLNRFSHTYSIQNIIDSWQHTWEQGYVYPMYGTADKDNRYSVEEFHPAVFSKMILSQILEQAGYGFSGAFIENNKQFEREIIAYTGDGTAKIGPQEVEKRKFRAGITNDPAPIEIIGLDTGNLFNDKVVLNIVAPFNDAPFVSATASFNPNLPFDRSGGFDITTNEWVCQDNGEYVFNYGLDFDFDFENTSSFDVDVSFPQGFKFQAYVEYFENGRFNVWPDSQLTIRPKIDTGVPGVRPNTSLLPVDENVTINVRGRKNTTSKRILAGTRVRMRLIAIAPDDGGFLTNGPISLFSPNKLPMETKLILKNTNNNFFRNLPQNSNIVQGDKVVFSGVFPSDKLKQKDIIIDLIRRYNLFIQVDPDNPRRLIFETRDEFYERGVILDWTDKKDYSQSDKIEILSDLQFKELLFTYKEDRDEINAFYTAETGDIYGQQKFIFENEFVKGENKIESPFSPTPLVRTAADIITPAINPIKPTGNTRVLYWSGLKPTNEPWIFTTKVLGLTIPIPITDGYPYAGHLDDPINPTIDLNFGPFRFATYIGLNEMTNNNMFNQYWSNYIKQISEGRLVRSRIYLSETDINFIKNNFNVKIFIKDNYYYINRIKDYKPLVNETTEVELLKIADGVRWNDKTKIPVTISTPQLPGLELNTGFDSGGNRGLVIGNDNINGGTILSSEGVLGPNNQLIVGNNNEVSGDSLVIGDSNAINDKSYVFGDRNSGLTDNFIVGDNNDLQESAVLLGSSDNVVTGEDSILIGSEGITASENDSIYLGNIIRAERFTGRLHLEDIKFSEVPKPFNGRRDYINYFDFSSDSVTTLTQGVFVPLNMSPTIGFSSGDFTLTSNGLVVFSGEHKTIFKIEAIVSGSSANNNQIHLAFFKNGSLWPCSEQTVVTSPGGRADSVAFQCFVELDGDSSGVVAPPPDNIQVYIKNETASSNFTLKNVNVIITEIDTQ